MISTFERDGPPYGHMVLFSNSGWWDITDSLSIKRFQLHTNVFEGGGEITTVHFKTYTKNISCNVRE